MTDVRLNKRQSDALPTANERLRGSKYDQDLGPALLACYNGSSAKERGHIVRFHVPLPAHLAIQWLQCSKHTFAYPKLGSLLRFSL